MIPLFPVGVSYAGEYKIFSEKNVVHLYAGMFFISSVITKCFQIMMIFRVMLQIRGMSVDEAIKQLSFANKKAAHIMIEVIKEAQEMAVSDHNVEYKSNLWIGMLSINQTRM